MRTSEEKVRLEISKLLDEDDSCPPSPLGDTPDRKSDFRRKYQNWYTRALRVIEALAPDRLEEFKQYYGPPPKRKALDLSNYVIQDYLTGILPSRHFSGPSFDASAVVFMKFHNQVTILQSVESRLNSVFADIRGALFADLQDAELGAAKKLMDVSLRAAGALAGVVLERHLKRVSSNHQINPTKARATISDLNDALKSGNVYETPTWRKIQYLADIRNKCAHDTPKEPSQAEVEELVDGVNTVVKTVY